MKPAPRHASGWLAQRSSSQQAGAGDVLEKLLRVGAEQKTHATGFSAAGKSTNTEILRE